MKPTVVALVAALVSGTAMYTVGARTSEPNAVLSPAALDSAVPGTNPRTSLQPTYAVTDPVVATPPRRATVRRASQTTAQETRPTRSWTKTALVIGGSAASGAGVGGAIAGKKGAWTGAAIGGGAASIYEATRRN